MMLETAACQANHRRFVERVLSSETVWGLQNDDGFAVCPSTEDEEREVIMFWSDRAYAARAARTSCPGRTPGMIALFDFLFRWLPGMDEDGHLAGTNWTGHLIGLEFEPSALRQETIDTMPDELLDWYRDRLDEALAAQNAS